MIKPKTLLFLLLFLPYALWVFAFVFMGLKVNSLFNSIVATISIIYAMGIGFWGVPYTLLLIGFFIWGRNKSWKILNKASSYLPFILTSLFYIIAFLLWIASIISSIFNPQLDFKEALFGGLNLAWYSSIAAAAVFFYGYFLVGLGKFIFFTIDSLGLINYDKELSDELTFDQAMLNSYNELKKLQ